MEDTETISELSCRICLVPCNANDLDAITVSADYKKCVGFEINEEDGALKLCQICMAELSLVKRFHEKCQTSELRLIKLRAENWKRLNETANSSDNDEQLFPINYNPNEMDITVMPLQVSMKVGGGDEQPPPVKRGRGRPKKIKPAPTIPTSDGSSSSNSWWKQNQAVKKAKLLPPLSSSAKIKRRENLFIDDPLLFPPPPLNDRVPPNPLQFLNSNDSKQNLIHKAAAVAAAAAVMNQQQHHNSISQQKPVNNTVPFFCGICNRRFPFKNQIEVQLHMKMHYGAAADNPFTSTNKTTTSNAVSPTTGVDPFAVNPRMHHFVYPNKFTQQPKGFPQRIAK